MMTYSSTQHDKNASQFPFVTEKTGKSRNLYTVIKDITSSLDWGLQYDGGVRHANTNDRLQAHLYDLWAKKRGFVPWVTSNVSRLDKDKWDAHRRGEATYYFAGNGGGQFTLVMPEIDVLKSRGLGTPEGALRFAEYLRDEEPIFQNRSGQKLYIERSTGGKGMHPYFIIDKLGADSASVNDYLKRLQVYLNWRAEQVSADIEMVEVKGGCPVVSYTDDGPTLERAGTLAKLPRVSTEEQEQQLRNTVVLTVNKLSLFLHDWEEKHKHVKKKTIVVEPSDGSISGKCFTDEMLAALPAYEKLAAQMMSGTKFDVFGKNRSVVSPHVVAIYFLIGKFFTENMNADGTMPTARWQEMWTSLHEAGVIERAWSRNRFFAIRNWLSSLPGCMDWQNMTYVPPTIVVEEDGTERRIKGQACKWMLGRDLMKMLELASNNHAGEKASLSITPQWVSTLRAGQLPPEQIPRPRIRQELRVCPDEILDQIPCFESYLATAA